MKFAVLILLFLVVCLVVVRFATSRTATPLQASTETRAFVLAEPGVYAVYGTVHGGSGQLTNLVAAYERGWSEWRCAACETVDTREYEGKKPHRWLKDIMEGPRSGKGTIVNYSWMLTDLPNGGKAEADICLEHGEVRVRELLPVAGRK
jgi:hypothetical protein